MEQDLIAFIRQRGVPEHKINLMIENKVDKYVIRAMDDDNLKHYLPQIGDRIAVRQFSKNEACDSQRKQSLLSSLRRKLLSRKGDLEEGIDSAQQTQHFMQGNKNANKTSRKIEIGWLNFESDTKSYRQVRKRRGGSTRKVDIPKQAKWMDIQELGKNLFFPNGESPLGKDSDFEFGIHDYSEQPFKSEETIGEMYSRTKINILRFYLATKPKQDTDALPELQVPKNRIRTKPSLELQTEDNGVSTKQPRASESTGPDALPELQVPKNRIRTKPNLELQTEDNGVSTKQPLVSESTGPDALPELQVPKERMHMKPNLELQTEESGVKIKQSQTSESAGSMDTEDILQRALEESNIDLNLEDEKSVALTDKFLSDLQNIEELGKLDDSETEVFFKTVTDNADGISGSVEMTVHRGPRTFQEVLSYFKDSTILKKVVNVRRILPNGEKEVAEDTGGVFRDLLTEFWSDFYERCTLGRDAKVPALRHDFGEEEWQSVCRIMIYGHKIFGYWPIKIAKSFLIKCMFPDARDDKDMLLNDFFNFVSTQEKMVIQAAIDNFETVDFDELLDALDTYHCRTRVSKENIRSIVIEIAHKELIQEASYVSDCWREIMQVSSSISFSAIHEIYGTLKPTNRKVIHMLKFPEVMNEQQLEVSKHLKRYIRELDFNNLALFLRFCTGSDLLITKTILVELSKMEGLQRRPVGHTCGCLLQLADQFENFMEFRNEFNNVLSSNVWVMDII